jgi:CheY-like chemotaxis protein
LLNLVLNARDAMPYGGRLVIGGRCLAAGAGAPPELAEGHYVCLTVSDSGAGMDAATLKRAAEPFFTTKGAGKGTGLGLSMVHGLAAQSGGAMRITSQPGDGTSVELWLPLSEAAAIAEVLPQPASFSATGRTYRVLVVDDDPLVVASTAAMLEDVGHVVSEALSGVHALDLLRLGTTVDVVLTDHAMPGMTGSELARQIRQHWPELPIILATGYAELPNGEDPGVPRLSKPYLQEELEAQIAKAVGGTLTNVIPLDSARRA